MKRQRELATWVGAILGSLCALLFAVAQSHAAENRGQFTQEFHQTYALAAGGRVALANINGSVHISGWDRNEVKVDAVRTGWMKPRLWSMLRRTASQSAPSIQTTTLLSATMIGTIPPALNTHYLSRETPGWTA